jgi:predicted RNA-binding protein YlqC (UPF0109 family)
MTVYLCIKKVHLSKEEFKKKSALHLMIHKSDLGREFWRENRKILGERLGG